MQDPDLPCGVTQSMCEPNDPSCARCGCNYSDHYEEDGEGYVPMKETLERYSEAEGIIYYPDGQVANACMLKNIECDGFLEGEYEPDWERDD